MRKLTMQPEPAMVSYSTAMEAIALEANFIANATQLAKQYFPSIVKSFNSLISAVDFSKAVKKKEFTKSQYIILDIVSKTDYEKLKSVRLNTPEGYRGNLLKTFGVVDTSLTVINSQLLPYIQEYKKYLANFVTNKDAKKSLLDMTKVANKTTNDTQKLVSDIAQLFDSGSHIAYQPFESVFENPQEVKKVFTEYQRLNPSFKTLDIKKIKTEIEQISELLDSVIKQIEGDRIQSLSPEALKSLSEGSYAVAKCAEAIAIVYFKLIAIFNIVPNMEDTITEDLLK